MAELILDPVPFPMSKFIHVRKNGDPKIFLVVVRQDVYDLIKRYDIKVEPVDGGEVFLFSYNQLTEHDFEEFNQHLIACGSSYQYDQRSFRIIKLTFGFNISQNSTDVIKFVGTDDNLMIFKMSV